MDLQQYQGDKLKILSFIMILMAITFNYVHAEDAIWRPETTLQVNSISDVDVSPDGMEVVYTVTEAKIEGESNEFITQVWKGKVDDLNSHIQFTTSRHSSTFPRWSPDGKWIAFLSRRSGANNLYLISPNGGEAVQVTDVTDGVQTFRWSPDSSMIAFIAKREEEPHSLQDVNLLEEVDRYSKKEKISSLFLIRAQPALQRPDVLTASSYNVIGEIDFHTVLEAFDWSPDNHKIAFTYTKETGQDSRWKNSQIAIIDLNSGKIKQLPKIAPHQSIPRYSPDGKFIAFLKSDENSSYSLTRYIALYSLSDGKFRELQKTPDEASFLVGPSLLGWSSDGAAVLYLEPLHTKFAIWNIPIDGSEIARLDDGNWTFNNPLLNSSRKWLGIALETLSKAPEAYVTSLSIFSPKRVSHVNDHLKDWEMPQTHVVHWKSHDGTEIEGLLTYPRDYRPGTRYPFLLIVHGGPMGVFSENFLGSYGIYPLAAFADAGFVVLRANPRGSCGYGRNFRYAVCSDLGGNDFQDLMSGVDMLIDRGIIDPNRMGVMGWSYGGYMTAWIVSQTNRFTAASMGAGISNWLSMSGTTDLHHFLSDYMGGEAWEKPSLYIQRSPLTYANWVSTPVLIQHGEDDKRVPISQSVEFYNALRKAKKNVDFAVYPRSTHRILEPKLHLDALQRNFNWFIKHVKNKKIASNQVPL